jgi:hypothetical protein
MSAPRDVEDVAAPLDALLVHAALGPLRHLAPPVCSVAIPGLCCPPADTSPPW